MLLFARSGILTSNSQLLSQDSSQSCDHVSSLSSRSYPPRSFKNLLPVAIFKECRPCHWTFHAVVSTYQHAPIIWFRKVANRVYHFYAFYSPRFAQVLPILFDISLATFNLEVFKFFAGGDLTPMQPANGSECAPSNLEWPLTSYLSVFGATSTVKLLLSITQDPVFLERIEDPNWHVKQYLKENS